MQQIVVYLQTQKVQRCRKEPQINRKLRLNESKDCLQALPSIATSLKVKDENLSTVKSKQILRKQELQHQVLAQNLDTKDDEHGTTDGFYRELQLITHEATNETADKRQDKRD